LIRLRRICLTAGVVVAATGCAGRQPYAAASHQTVAEDGPPAKQVLSPQDQAEVRRILRSVAAGEEPVDPPAPAPLGMRFSDVPDAVGAACAEVEMAVVSSERIEDGKAGLRFSLKTIEDWPAELIVLRTGNEGVYEATAKVGRFGNHTERAEALLEALQRQMLAFGAKRRFNRDDN
jgi:hypothetical protein